MLDSKKPRFERILLKLSGEALAGNKIWVLMLKYLIKCLWQLRT